MPRKERDPDKLWLESTDPNASKALITTTSDFQPQILSGTEFSPFIPHRLELKNGPQLLKWLNEIRKGKSDHEK
ncbi:MAG: hypothetical protein HQ567_17575 [Candidatus Nealsonbacteria bacterium]|nr:hypothetical protein [Candidatus Nealsonbacteria bacterium]